MSSLETLAGSAGLHTLQAQVVLPNFEFPLVGRLPDVSQTQKEPLFCDQQWGEAADLTMLYFLLPGCENCRSGALAIDRLIGNLRSAEQTKSLKVCARVVVSDWSTSDEVSQEFLSIGFKVIPGIVWDAEGVLVERLAVVAQPAFFLADKTGQLLAYQNGPVEFGSPGFEVFWQSLLKSLKKEGSPDSVQTLGRVFALEQSALSSQPVSFLNQNLLSVIWLAVLVGLCYAFRRFFLRLRKNLTGS